MRLHDADGSCLAAWGSTAVGAAAGACAAVSNSGGEKGFSMFPLMCCVADCGAPCEDGNAWEECILEELGA